ncbi:MAG TPA: hypothetical protein PLW34_04275, partial [Termitinemataceae bacterium]|nr:hypothetical protein [Termitinemataceae bacterium]HOM23057.1 hypothetical protein [Termitinemataceae bacterium]HPP99907.1 hypothetical protein [Termitinemataceae bacterium]
MQESASGGIESFQAEVKVYSSVDRKPYSNRLVSQYRLATKLIDGELYTRIDFPADTENKIAARGNLTDMVPPGIKQPIEQV